MKHLFWLLLIANIGLFAWQYQVGTPNYDSSRVPKVNKGNLNLLSEERPKDEKASLAPSYGSAFESDNSSSRIAVVNSGQAGGLDLNKTCFEIGPFSVESFAKSILSRLSPITSQSRIQQRERVEKQGYWVYLEPAASYTKAQSIVRRLKDGGLQDVIVMSGERWKNAISLGFYSDQIAALKRQEQLRSLGYKAKMRVNSITVSEWWTSHEVEVPAKAEPLLGNIFNEFGVSSQLVNCN